MSGDLVSLRMLVVASAKKVLDIWQQGATQASVPIEFMAADASLAKQTLARGGVDICIIDSGLPDADRTAVLAAARAAKPKPFVAFSAPAGSAPPDGYDGNLEEPAGGDQARQRVEVCIRVKISSRVLIVDNSGTMRSIVRKILSASHFALDVHEAAEGIAAVNHLRSEKFDLVFLDYNMPGTQRHRDPVGNQAREPEGGGGDDDHDAGHRACRARPRVRRARLPEEAVLSGRYRRLAHAPFRPERAAAVRHARTRGATTD